MFLELWLLRYQAKGRNKQNVEGDICMVVLKYLLYYGVGPSGPCRVPSNSKMKEIWGVAVKVNLWY
jgi:hypothetical protein